MHNIIVLFQGRNSEQSGHAKFTNYSFDKDEFLDLVIEASTHVKNNKHRYSPKLHDEL